MKTKLSRKTVGRASVFAVILISVCANRSAAQSNTFPSSGNAGIGTTTPTYKLEVKEDNTSQVNVFVHAATANTGSSGRAVGIVLGDSTNARAQIGLIDNASFGGGGNDLLLRAAGGIGFAGGNTGMGVSNQLYLNSSGNVGIGTTAPSNRFNVQGGTNTFPFTSGSTSTDTFFRVTNSVGGPSGGALDFGQNGVSGSWLQSRNAGNYTLNYPLLLNPNGGSVGIGTTSPNAAQLHIYENTPDGADGLKIQNASATGTYPYMQIGQAGSSGYGVSGWANAGLVEGTASGGLVLSGYAGPLKFQTSRIIRAFIDTNGNFGIGTTTPQYKLDVAGNINSNATITGNNIVAKYQDVAEWVPATNQLVAGTVVVLDSTKSNQVTSSSQAYDTRVAGVVSAQPGIALGERGNNKVLVATIGRVRVKVDASKTPIHVGDLLVTSDIPGVAMKSEPVNIGGIQLHRPGTLIGKALEPLEKGSGEILVLLSLQ
jgi:hypothetical protein